MTVAELVRWLQACRQDKPVILKVSDDFGEFVLRLHHEDLELTEDAVIITAEP